MLAEIVHFVFSSHSISGKVHLCSHLCPPLARASELVGYVHSACFEVEGHKQSVIGGRDGVGRDFHGRGGAGKNLWDGMGHWGRAGV